MKKGFTLIELLAVIVILAIIALIATPIILGIIEDARNEAKIRSAELYITALEQAIMRKKMNGDTSFNPTSCSIENSVIICDGESIPIDVDGNLPTSGTITLNNGKVVSHTLGYLDGATIVNGVIQTPQDSENIGSEYVIGEEVTFNPGDQDRTWSVIAEDKDTVTLMLTENLGDAIPWYAYSYQDDRFYTSYGPKDALEYLNSLTINWDNVEPIESFTYINNLEGTQDKGYQRIEIRNGYTKLIHENGEIETTLNEEFPAKARIISKEEIYEIASKTNPNLTEDNLREFILNNILALNELYGSNYTEVDEVVSLFSGNYGFIEYHDISTAVMIMKNELGVEFDTSLPSYLYQLDYSEPIYAYWTLSSENSTGAWLMESIGSLMQTTVDRGGPVGVCPVITIPKSKLQ